MCVCVYTVYVSVCLICVSTACAHLFCVRACVYASNVCLMCVCVFMCACVCVCVCVSMFMLSAHLLCKKRPIHSRTQMINKCLVNTAIKPVQYCDKNTIQHSCETI